VIVAEGAQRYPGAVREGREQRAQAAARSPWVVQCDRGDHMRSHMSDTSDPAVGLFVVAYDIATGLAGAPRLVLHLAVDSPAQTIGGQGRGTQAVDPPLHIDVQVAGDFTYMP
jgi:hypothetical protein